MADTIFVGQLDKNYNNVTMDNGMENVVEEKVSTDTIKSCVNSITSILVSHGVEPEEKTIVTAAYLLYKLAFMRLPYMTWKQATMHIHLEEEEVIKKRLKDGMFWDSLKELYSQYHWSVFREIVWLHSLDETKYTSDNLYEGTINLINRILDIKSKEYVASICGKRGTHMARTVQAYPGIKIQGIGDSDVDYAVFRTQIASRFDEYPKVHRPDVDFYAWDDRKYKYKYTMEEGNPFYVFRHSRFYEKFDKAFLDCPSSFLDKWQKYLTYYKRFSELDKVVQGKCSIAWYYNEFMMHITSDTGKAVSLMQAGEFSSAVSLKARKFFVDNGYVEAVIKLPPKLTTSIHQDILVLSHGNKSIRFIDASNIYTEGRRLNVLSDENVDEIIRLLYHDSKLSKSISNEDVAVNDYSMDIVHEDKAFEEETFAPISKTKDTFDCPDDMINRAQNDFYNVIDVVNSDVAANDYVMNVDRYLTPSLDARNGVRLGDLLKAVKRSVPLTAAELDEATSMENTDLKYIRISDIQDGIISEELPSFKALDAKLMKYLLKDKDILVTKSCQPFKSAVVELKEGQFAFAVGNMYVLEPDKDKVNPYYLKAFLESEKARAMIKALSTGNSLSILTVDMLKNIIVPLPDKETQEQVASAYLYLCELLLRQKRDYLETLESMKNCFDECTF